MTIDELRELFFANDFRPLQFCGSCWDCGKNITVTAHIDPDEKIIVDGGAVYKKDGGFRVKCDGCYKDNPSIEQECDVYSRVVGYLTSTRGWNKGKKEEFRLRKTFGKAIHG